MFFQTINPPRVFLTRVSGIHAFVSTEKSTASSETLLINTAYETDTDNVKRRFGIFVAKLALIFETQRLSNCRKAVE